MINEKKKPIIISIKSFKLTKEKIILSKIQKPWGVNFF